MFNSIAMLSSGAGGGIMMYILIGVFVVLMVVMFIFSRKKNKKQQDSYTTMLNSLEPGDKVYLISRLVGYVVKVETTITGEKFVTVETGIEGRKSTLTFDVQAIHAVLEKKNAPKPVEAPAEVPAVETVKEEVVEQAPAQTEEKSE
ncbi:MAG: preprotein translocase subunit YajC [Clostridiales bacterium]|nr:preprotein translocase subunit YajC [Clostridiales bacterium]